MDNWYSLRTAIIHKKYDEALSLLQKFSKGIISDRRTFYSSLLVLVNEGYVSEVKEIMGNTYSSKSDVDLKRIINNSISEYEMIQNLTEEQKDIVDSCIEKIKEGLRNHEYDLVYDLCEWGYYVSKLPIFLYYEGKCFYRCRKYEIARKILLKYVELGSTKVSKAYLYLTRIYDIKDDIQMYFKYKRRIVETEIVSLDSFYFYNLLGKTVDRKKNYLQLTTLNSH